MAKERALAMRQLWRLLALLLRVEFDNVVDAQHGDGGLGGELDHLHLGDGRLDYAGGQVVLDVARDAVEPVPAKLGLGRVGLRGVVVGAQLGDDVGGVLRGVDSELLRDDEERLGKLCDGELLARAERGGEVLEVDGEGRLYAAATGDHGGRLERALDGTHGVVERALDLVEHVRVGAAQQQRRRALRLAPLHHEVVVVADALLEHLRGGGPVWAREHGTQQGIDGGDTKAQPQMSVRALRSSLQMLSSGHTHERQTRLKGQAHENERQTRLDNERQTRIDDERQTRSDHERQTSLHNEGQSLERQCPC
eukprot:4114095-Pleurochrysis_carterae.AAC.1